MLCRTWVCSSSYTCRQVIFDLKLFCWSRMWQQCIFSEPSNIVAMSWTITASVVGCFGLLFLPTLSMYTEAWRRMLVLVIILSILYPHCEATVPLMNPCYVNFVRQDKAESYHRASQYVTVHLFLIYYKGEKTKTIISVCLENINESVFCLHESWSICLVKILERDTRNIYWFSVVSPAQHKNTKKFITCIFINRV